MKRVPDEQIINLYRRLEEQAGGQTQADPQAILARVARDLGISVEQARSAWLDHMTNWGAG